MEENQNPRVKPGCSILGILGIALCVILLILVLFPVIFRSTCVGSSRRTSCLNNLKQIGTALNMYESDWDNRFPLVSGPGREFERVWPGINKPFPSNLRTKNSDGERRWFQDLLAPYARNRKIFMCPKVSENDTWKTPAGTIFYYRNRHGGWTKAEGDTHGTDSRRPVYPPHGSSRPKTVDISGKVEDYPQLDPPTSYWFNAVTSRNGKSLLISGQSEAICERTADAPLVWDTPCGYGSGKEAFAHEDSINVVYADGHAKNFAIPSQSMDSWRTSQFWLLHGSEGWFGDE